MKITKLVLFILVILSFNAYAGEKDILGTWINPSGNHIEIYQENNKYYGKIIKLDEPIYPADHEYAGKEKMDINNPDPKKHSNKILGMIFMKNFVYKKGQFKNGKIYDPKNGKTYYAKMKLKGDIIKLRGSIDKMGLAGRTQEWKRLK